MLKEKDNIEDKPMEFDLLIKLCEASIFEKSDFSESELSITDLDVLLKLAHRQKVTPLVYEVLTKNGVIPFLTKEKQASLKQMAFSRILTNLKQTKELTRILELFSENDIEAIPYKGVVLAHEAYGSVGARVFSDIDLMVSEKDLKLITEILKKEHYIHKNKMAPIFMKHFIKQNCEFNFEYFENGNRIFHIEPHWRIGQKMLQLDIGLEDLRPLIIEKQLFNVPMKLFTPEGMLLSTCLHHFGKEQWLRLKHICDIACIIQRFNADINWKVLLELSRTLKVENILLFGIQLTKRFFPIDLPNEIIKELQSQDLDSLVELQYDRIRYERLENNQNSVISRMKFHLKLRKKISTKLKIIYYHLEQIIKPTAEDFGKEEISQWQYFLLFFTKPFRLLNTYFQGK